VTSPIIVRKVNNGWVTILLAIITNLAKGFHWLASRFAFKPITQVQADFYVPIVEWGWNYAFGTRVIVLPNGHAIVSNGTTTATITLPNGTVVTTTYTGGGGGVVKWVVTLYGGGTWVIQDVYGNSASGSGNGSGTFRIGGTTDVITLNAPGACQVHPSRVVNVTAGSTISFTVDCTPSWSLYFEIPYSCNLVNTYTWTVSDNYGDTATGVITFNNMQGSGAFTYPNSYTTVVLYASISSWSSGGWYVDNTISPTVATVAQPPSGTTTVTFTAWCTSWGRTATTTATTTSTSTYNPSGWWTLYISVSDSPGVSYTIKDNYGNSYSNSKSVSNVAFASYWPDASVTLTASTVPGCTITPASTTVTSSGQNQYVGFTVSCGSGTSTPTPTPTPTSTPPPTSTAPTSTTSSPPPTSPTTTFTSGTTVTVPTTTGISLGCAKGSVQIGQAGVFECYFAWNGYTPVSITATDNAYGLVASETATFYYMQGYGNQYPDVLVGSWQASGHCPIGWEPTVGISGGSFNQPLSNYGTSAAYTWWVTVSAYCQPKGGLGTQFAFFTRWSPPELPITWLLAKGGTNALAPLEPLYLEAWNEYVSMWLSENGFALDLLLLIALILPILVKPATRRIRLLT
jgi:hypothetical protein